MKMMCILGRQHPAHTGLVAGEIYEVTMSSTCCRNAAFAEGSTWRLPFNILRCRRCGVKRPIPKLVPWGPWRFIPWNPSQQDIDEANSLYRTDKETV